jgi:hypothetical protein
MKKTFVMRGQTASGLTEVLNFSGYKPGYAYRITELKLWPSGNLGGADNECFGTVTAGKTAVTPIDPNFNDEGLIAVATAIFRTTNQMGPYVDSVINDTFLITQNLILMVQDTGAGAAPINWQCRFESVKMSGPEEAATNYKQYSISDE